MKHIERKLRWQIRKSVRVMKEEVKEQENLEDRRPSSFKTESVEEMFRHSHLESWNIGKIDKKGFELERVMKAEIKGQSDRDFE